MPSRLRTTLLGGAAFAILCAAPYKFTASADDWAIRLGSAQAFAASGSGKDGDGSSGGSGSDSSGSGSGSGDSDNSGSGSSNSGSGSGSDDDNSGSGSSGSGRGDQPVPGGSGCDSRADAAEDAECAAGSPPATDTTPADHRIAKIEVSGDDIEVRYGDGTREGIENGRYERKDARGRTVEKRAATDADIDRLASLANAISIDNVPSSRTGGSDVRKIEIDGADIEVNYASGWKEKIKNGRYELKDPSNRTVVERPATDEDRDRLLAAAG